VHDRKDIELLATCWTSAGDASPLYQSEVSPVDIFHRIRAVSDAGFRGIGLLHADLCAARDLKGKGVLRDIGTALADNGIRHVELEFLTDWYASGSRRETSDRKRAELLEWAAQLNAHHVKIGSDVRKSPEQTECRNKLSLIKDAFWQLCADAAVAGTKVALEPQPYTEVATLGAGLEIVEEIGSPAGGLLIDIWHSSRGEWDLSQLSLKDQPWLTAAELNDAGPSPVGTLIEDTVNRRKPCGKGAFDIPGFISAMKRSGFQSFWGVEILSQDYRQYPIEFGLRLAYETTMQQFARIPE